MSEQLKLENQICFPFYAISRKIVQLYTPYLNELNITYPQYLVLLILWENDNILVKEICQKLWLETNTVSPLLKTLHGKWLLDRKQTPENKKQVRIFLTQDWKKLKKLAEEIPAKLSKSTQIDENKLKELHSNLWDLMETLEIKNRN